MKEGSIAFLPAIHAGQLPSEELMRQADAGERPRWEHLELARRVGAVLVDGRYLDAHGGAVTRLVARRVGLFPAQVVEAFLRRRDFRTVCAWGDRLGLPLALLYKLARWQGDLIMVSAWLSRPKKAVFLSRLGVHSHLRAIVSGSRVQLEHAERLGVPRDKLCHLPWPVDTSFWRPVEAAPADDVVASVGWEARDYPTLLGAAAGLDVHLELAVGVTLFAPAAQADEGAGEPAETDLLSSVEPILRRTYGYRHQKHLLPALAAGQETGRLRVRQQLHPRAVRDLYARARFVVVPVHDVDNDCGVTTILEAMAMGKAVIATRTRGQVGVLQDGVQGVYVPPNDPAALRSAMAHLLAHPEEAARMGRAGRRRVEEHFSLDAYLERAVPLFAPAHPSRGHASVEGAAADTLSRGNSPRAPLGDVSSSP